MAWGLWPRRLDWRVDRTEVAGGRKEPARGPAGHPGRESPGLLTRLGRDAFPRQCTAVFRAPELACVERSKTASTRARSAGCFAWRLSSRDITVCPIRPS